MDLALTSLIISVLTVCPVYAANTCGNAPNGDTICLIRTSATYAAAKSACEGMQQHLLEIIDQPVQDFIMSSILDLGMDDGNLYWIGLRKDTTVHRWEHSGTALSYINWHPSSTKASECAFLSGTDGQWQDLTCVAPIAGYFCQEEGTLTTTSSNVQPTTEGETTTVTLPLSTIQRQTTASLTTTGANVFTTTKQPTTIETTTLTSPALTTTVKEITTETSTTTTEDTTTTNRPTTLQTTTLTSLAWTTTEEEPTTKTLTTTGDDTTMSDELTTLLKTTVTSLATNTITQQQSTPSTKQTTTDEGTKSSAVALSSSKTVSTRSTFTTIVDKTTTGLAVETTPKGEPSTAKTTKFVSTTPTGTTRVETTTATQTSLGFKGTTAAGSPTTKSDDVTTSQALPSEITSQSDAQTSFTDTSGETRTQENTSPVSDFKELSTEACNGYCKPSLEERLANATLGDVNNIIDYEDLGSEDMLQIQGWFEDNAYLKEDEEDYLNYTKVYLKTFNDILMSPMEDTFELANPAIFAESCNEILQDFVEKSSFNDTLEISFSNIETEIVRESVDTFTGYTSDFNTDENEQQLDGFISVQDDWLGDYNTTDNITIDIIVVLYQASMIEDLGNNETNEIVSSFVSIKVIVDGVLVSMPVIFGLELDDEKLKAQVEGKRIITSEPLCVFWDYSLGNASEGFWNTFGCEVKSQNETYVQCSCNHTTNFAVLMQTTKVEIRPEDAVALSLLSLIGLGISTAALLITIIVLVCLPSLKSDRVFIHKHLVVALIIAQTLFISTTGAIHQEMMCKLVAIFLHYFYLAVFMWMLIEGVHLYLEIVQVFSRFDGKNKTVHYTVIGWGLPLIVVGVSVAIRWNNYGVGQSCWLSIEDGLIWAFVGPVAFVIVTNFVILLMVIRVVFRASSARGKDESEYKHLIAAVKGALFLLPLLGLAWAVGFMSINEGTLVFQYLFVILNSLQGLFIFLFYCAMNKEVRTALSRRFSQVALESGGSKSFSLRAVAKLRSSSGKSTSPVFRLTDSNGTSGLPSKTSGFYSEDEGKKESISASGISVHQKELDSQHIPTKNEQSKSPFSPDYN